MAEPTFYISDANKDAMVEQFVPQTIYGMERMLNPPGSPIADDFIDICARAAAVMLSSDDRIKTPRDMRLAAETVAVHVLRHMKRYAELQGQTGITVFETMLANADIPEVMRKSWGEE